MFAKNGRQVLTQKLFGAPTAPKKMRNGPPSVAQLIMMHSHARVHTFTHLTPLQAATQWRTMVRSDVLASMIRKFAK